MTESAIRIALRFPAPSLTPLPIMVCSCVVFRWSGRMSDGVSDVVVVIVVAHVVGSSPAVSTLLVVHPCWLCWRLELRV